jgi:replication-associated recombination protein RarA
MPGCRVPLAELVTYLAKAPKSTRAYEGYNRAERLAKRDPTLLVPIAMRDIPVGSMEAIGCGEAYKYHPEYMCVASHPHLERAEVVIILWFQASGDERLFAITRPRGDDLAQRGRHVG